MSLIYEYAPWSKSILSNLTNEFNILDIQLGGACNLNCIYCDTPKYRCQCKLDINSIERILATEKIIYIYVCGLGEPTATGNIDVLKKILKLCEKYSVKLSMFSNCINLDDEMYEYIKRGLLNILFKLDSFEPKTITYLYGADKSDVILKNYERLKNNVYLINGTTNLGASIVPTKINFREIYSIIDWCIDNGIFPLLGQLEKAGKCDQIYDDIKLSNEELENLKQYLNNKCNITYELPICPATISGIHITNDNNIIVDQKTGLSCGWFWLNEPQMIKIGSIIDMNFNEITDSIIKYRKEKFNDVLELKNNYQKNVFGGCGGNAKVLLNKYIEIYK